MCGCANEIDQTNYTNMIFCIVRVICCLVDFKKTNRINTTAVCSSICTSAYPHISKSASLLQQLQVQFAKVLQRR